MGIDSISTALPSVLFVATTNFYQGVDEAFLSRADLVMHFALPDEATITAILQHSLEELALLWPTLRSLLERRAELAQVAKLCAGWDGRRVRKLILAALAQRTEVARDPSLLSIDDLRRAAQTSAPATPGA